MFSKSLFAICLFSLLTDQIRADRGDPCAQETEVVEEKCGSSTCGSSCFGTDPNAPLTVKDVRKEAKNRFEAGRFEDALICYNKIIVTEPNAKDYEDRADCLVKLNRKPEAINDLMSAVSLTPKNGVIRGKLCNLLEEEGRLDEVQLYEEPTGCYFV